MLYNINSEFKKKISVIFLLAERLSPRYHILDMIWIPYHTLDLFSVVNMYDSVLYARYTKELRSEYTIT